MINIFIINRVKEKIKKVLDIDIDFVGIDQKRLEYMLYCVASGLNDNIKFDSFEIELRKDSYAIRRRCDALTVLNYKAEVFDAMFKTFAFDLLNTLYKKESESIFPVN